jgi:hypothetical protein
MATERLAGIGLHLSAAGFQQDRYVEGDLSFSLGNSRIQVDAGPPKTGSVYHKTDGGRRDQTWDHAAFFIPENIGVGSPPNAAVNISYWYSNRDLDVQSGTDRTEISSNLVGPFDQAGIAGEDSGVGRYRYLLFALATNVTETESFIQEWGTIQLVSGAVEFADHLVLEVEGQTVPTTIRIVRGSTRTLTFHYQIGLSPSADPYDISGSTVKLSIAKSSARAVLDGFALVGPLSCTIDDGEGGDASYLLGTNVPETDLEAGLYIAEVKMEKGAVRERHIFNIEIEGPVTPAS